MNERSPGVCGRGDRKPRPGPSQAGGSGVVGAERGSRGLATRRVTPGPARGRRASGARRGRRPHARARPACVWKEPEALVAWRTAWQTAARVCVRPCSVRFSGKDFSHGTGKHERGCDSRFAAGAAVPREQSPLASLALKTPARPGVPPRPPRLVFPPPPAEHRVSLPRGLAECRLEEGETGRDTGAWTAQRMDEWVAWGGRGKAVAQDLARGAPQSRASSRRADGGTNDCLGGRRQATE